MFSTAFMFAQLMIKCVFFCLACMHVFVCVVVNGPVANPPTDHVRCLLGQGGNHLTERIARMTCYISKATRALCALLHLHPNPPFAPRFVLGLCIFIVFNPSAVFVTEAHQAGSCSRPLRLSGVEHTHIQTDIAHLCRGDRWGF